MAAESIEVVQMTRPSQTRIMKTFRDETSPDLPVDITGWTIKLIVKPSIDLPDSRAFFSLSAVIVTPALGVYRFDFGLAQTALPPGKYPGEIRWWTGSTAIAAVDAIPVDFIVGQAVKSVV